MTRNDLGPAGIQDPFQLFTYLVETGGHVVATSDKGNGPFVRFGYDVEVYEKDLRMMSFSPESLDAFWWSTANAKYSIEDAFRILQGIFKSLRPKKGILALSFQKTGAENAWSARTLMTVLRQSGFQLFHSFENEEEHLYFCQRI